MKKTKMQVKKRIEVKKNKNHFNGDVVKQMVPTRGLGPFFSPSQ
jgi:hypothetical protein